MTIPKSDRDYERFSCDRHQPTVLADYDQDDLSPQADILARIQGNEGGEPSIRQIYVELDGNDDILTQYTDETGQEAISTGDWTMVIHEGLLGFLYDATINEDITFDAFWRYNRIGDNEYISDCTQTILGWYHTLNPENDENEQWGCFWGEKLSGPYEPEEIQFANDQPVLTETPDPTQARECMEIINEREEDGDLTWIRRNNGNFDPNANLARDNPFANAVGSFGEAARLTTQQGNCEGNGFFINECTLESYNLLGLDPDTIDMADLPETINWNDVNGRSFFPPIVNQQ